MYFMWMVLMLGYRSVLGLCIQDTTLLAWDVIGVCLNRQSTDYGHGHALRHIWPGGRQLGCIQVVTWKSVSWLLGPILLLRLPSWHARHASDISTDQYTSDLQPGVFHYRQHYSLALNGRFNAFMCSVTSCGYAGYGFVWALTLSLYSSRVAEQRHFQFFKSWGRRSSDLLQGTLSGTTLHDSRAEE